MRALITHICQYLFADALRAQEKRVMFEIPKARYEQMLDELKPAQGLSGDQKLSSTSLFQAFDSLGAAATSNINARKLSVSERLIGKPFSATFNLARGKTSYVAGMENMVNKEIEELARKRMNIAEGKAVGGIRYATLLQQRLSQFNAEKAKACRDVLGHLKEQQNAVQRKLDNARIFGTRDRGELEWSAKRLAERVKAAETVEKDSKDADAKRSAGAVDLRVNNARALFTKIVSAYYPESLQYIDEALRKFAANETAEQGQGLQDIIARVQEKMGDSTIAQTLQNAANEMTGGWRRWDTTREVLKAGATGIIPYLIWNKRRYGVVNPNRFKKAEAAAAIPKLATERMEEDRKQRGKPLAEQIERLGKLPEGQEFTLSDGEEQRLIITDKQGPAITAQNIGTGRKYRISLNAEVIANQPKQQEGAPEQQRVFFAVSQDKDGRNERGGQVILNAGSGPPLAFTQFNVSKT